jgi:hypothetical protein
MLAEGVCVGERECVLYPKLGSGVKAGEALIVPPDLSPERNCSQTAHKSEG